MIPSSRAERSEAEGPLLSTLHPVAAEQKKSLDFVPFDFAQGKRFTHFARNDGNFLAAEGEIPARTYVRSIGVDRYHFLALTK